MTTLQRFEEMLTNNGVFESQAKQIMELAKPKFAETMPEYNVTWERPANEYPNAFYTIGFATIVKPAALQWIDENLPKAWFRAMFV